MRDPSDGRLRSVRTISREAPRKALRVARRGLDRGVTLSDQASMEASARATAFARAQARLARASGHALALARLGSRLPVWTLDGPALRVRVLGPRGTADYLAPSLGLSASDVHGDDPTQLRGLGRRGTAWLRAEADALIVQVPAWLPVRIADDALVFESPAWVDMVADLPRDADHVLAERGRSTRQRIRALERKGLTPVLTQDESRLRAFFDEMYEPWIAHRFGSTATRSSFEQCRWWFDRGGLMEVRDGPSGPALAAQLMAFVGATCLHGEIGVVREAMEEVERTHVMKFLTWATLVGATERGCRIVNFGGTRGCMSDGVFVYKARWGARAVPASRIISKWVVAVGERSGTALRWIDEMAFLTTRHGQVLRVVADETAPPLEDVVAGSVQGIDRLTHAQHSTRARGITSGDGRAVLD
jgi:hypothetical protein